MMARRGVRNGKATISPRYAAAPHRLSTKSSARTGARTGEITRIKGKHLPPASRPGVTYKLTDWTHNKAGEGK